MGEALITRRSGGKDLFEDFKDFHYCWTEQSSDSSGSSISQGQSRTISVTLHYNQYNALTTSYGTPVDGVYFLYVNNTVQPMTGVYNRIPCKFVNGKETETYAQYVNMSGNTCRLKITTSLRSTTAGWILDVTVYGDLLPGSGGPTIGNGYILGHTYIKL